MIIQKQNIGKRKIQEDSMFAKEENGATFAVVADGLGGMSAGAEASRCVVKSAEEILERNVPTPDNAQALLREFKETAQACIRALSQEQNLEARSTVAALLIVEKIAFIMHSGDSRVYRFNSKTFLSRTRDHSIPQLLLDSGRITEEEMGSHPDQGKLFNCLGGARGNDAKFESFEISEGDWFVLCTDGFWEHLSRDEIAELSERSFGTAQTLLDKAVERGGECCDNATFIAVYP